MFKNDVVLDQVVGAVPNHNLKHIAKAPRAMVSHCFYPNSNHHRIIIAMPALVGAVPNPGRLLPNLSNFYIRTNNIQGTIAPGTDSRFLCNMVSALPSSLHLTDINQKYGKQGLQILV
jgi:hypothetical protein